MSVSKPPLLAINGDATDEEVAAIVAVVQALAASAAAPSPAPPQQPSAWASPARRVRQPHRPGPGAWRASAFPGS